MEFDSRIQGRWGIALACGLVSVALLFAPASFWLLGPLSVPLALGSSLIGLIMGILSFAAKEKKRLFAIPGLILAAVAPALFASVLFLDL
jgi:hypothetical protein